MGLYLCVFKNDSEVEGVEIGFYDDFYYFRRAVEEVVEGNKYGSVCPTLMMHSDSDGVWSVEEAKKLKDELNMIKNVFSTKPPIEFKADWQKEVKKLLGLQPNNLYESFIDIDGELLIDRIIQLCDISIRENEPILFQ